MMLQCVGLCGRSGETQHGPDHLGEGTHYMNYNTVPQLRNELTQGFY